MCWRGSVRNKKERRCDAGERSSGWHRRFFILSVTSRKSPEASSRSPDPRMRGGRSPDRPAAGCRLRTARAMQVPVRVRRRVLSTLFHLPLCVQPSRPSSRLPVSSWLSAPGCRGWRGRRRRPGAAVHRGGRSGGRAGGGLSGRRHRLGPEDHTEIHPQPGGGRPDQAPGL